MASPERAGVVAKYQREKAELRRKLEDDQLARDSKYVVRLQAGIDGYNEAAKQANQSYLEKVDNAARRRRELIDKIRREHEVELARAAKQRMSGVHAARQEWDREKKATLDCVKKSRIAVLGRYEKDMRLLRLHLDIKEEDKDDIGFVDKLHASTKARDMLEAFVVDDEQVALPNPSYNAHQTRQPPAVATQEPKTQISIAEPRAQAVPTLTQATSAPKAQAVPAPRSLKRTCDAGLGNNVDCEEAQGDAVMDVFREHPEPGLLEIAPAPAGPAHTSRKKVVREPEPGMMPSQFVSNRELSPQPWPTRTITYDEVYQGGNADHKHVIIAWPPKGTRKRYYIIRCDEHNVHFGKYPTHGGAKHIWSAAHRAKDKSHARAVSMLGIEVVDCNDALMGQNNAVSVAAMAAPGWKPFNPKSKKARMPLKFESPEPESRQLPQPQPRQRPVPTPRGISRPKPFHLYIGTCKEAKNPVLVLGWANDLTPAGQPDNYRSTHLVREPECYQFDPVTKDIVGWSAGYEDGGPKEHLREFPVLWACDVDPDGDPCWGMMWAEGELLSKFDTWTTDDDDALRISVRHYFAHDVHGFANIEAMALAKGKKLKQYIILSEDDDNLTVFSRTPSMSLSPVMATPVMATPVMATPVMATPVMATQPIVFKRKAGRPRGSKTKRHSTLVRQRLPLVDAQQLLLGNTGPPANSNKRDREEAGPDDSAQKRPRHSLPSSRPTTTQPKKHIKPSRISTGGMSAPAKPSDPMQPLRTGFTAVNAASSLPTPSTHNDVWVKPENELSARDQLKSLPQMPSTNRPFTAFGAANQQPRTLPLSIPSHPQGRSLPQQSSMATPISASPSTAPGPLHGNDSARKNVQDVFNLVGVIRRKDSWARPANTDDVLRLQTVIQDDGWQVAEGADDAPIKLTLDPRGVVHARRISSGPDHAQANLTMIMDDDEEITLMFARDVRGRDTRAATLAARQFQRWLVSRNDSMEMPKVESHRYGL